MSGSQLDSVLPSGEALRYTETTRSGDPLGLTDERLLVRVDGTVTSVAYDSIDEVTAQEVDWFVGVLSVGLVGFGLLSVQRNPLLASGFVLAGVVSLALVYRKRGKVAVNVHDRPKPLTFRLDDVQTFLSRLESHMNDYEQRLHEQGAPSTDGPG
ncbi:hypothetical protein [Haloarchaeobius iranensis]|uniref:Uncharacterized protein n=1 Tax=Haloarchaeobius iranensis TaxID=996166 RepID=A0A1G9UY03_9EURY|nr:hypothetical protein [Haloarchaeobius iranensis]SDM64822.1 hypothetical protein SAMN05192554_10573 [Haloarchaeobius iranensis]